MQEKDYNNYDYIDVIVKKQNKKEIISAYSSFLWEKTEEKEDRRYNDVIHLSFRRDVKIQNKDRLTYLQVYYETALNKKAEIKFKKHSRSISAICNVAFFSLAGLLGIGVFIYFYKTFLSIVLGSILALMVLTLDVLAIKGIKKRFLGERKDFSHKMQMIDKEIKEILSSVNVLTKKGQTQTKLDRGLYEKE